ncbi:MAG: pentapeptide repeat-containing protein [Pseudomonadota bacterium]
MRVLKDQTNPFSKEVELSLLLQALNESARTSRTTLTTLLVVTIYLGAVLLGTTHDDLFVGGEIVVPQIGLEVPLLASYIISPLVFLYLHIGLLVQLRVLHSRLELFLRHSRESGAQQSHELVFPFIYLHLNFVPRELSWVIRITTVLAIYILPISLLAVTTLIFLPYQHVAITRLHKVILIIDLFAVLYFHFSHPASKFSAAIRRWPDGADWRDKVQVACMCLLCVPVGLLVGFAHTPGDLSGEIKRNLSEGQLTAPIRSIHKPSTPVELFALTWNPLDYLCEVQGFDFACRYLKPRSRVLLRERVPIATSVGLRGTEGLEQVLSDHAVGWSMRGRSLRFAVLSDKVLSNTDFREADLYGANLSGTKLGSSRFERADLRHANLMQAFVGRARFSFAALTFARFDGATLTGSSFSQSDLRGAELRRVRAIGVNFTDARISGAHAAQANFSGSVFISSEAIGARFDGANLNDSDMRGAWLAGAHFWRAKLNRVSLSGARMTGARFVGAEMRHADFSFTDMRRADLSLAKLTASSFKFARLEGTRFGDNELMLTDFRMARFGDYNPNAGLRDYEHRILTSVVTAPGIPSSIGAKHIANYVKMRSEFKADFETIGKFRLPTNELLLHTLETSQRGSDKLTAGRVLQFAQKLGENLRRVACATPSARLLIARRFSTHLGLEADQKVHPTLDAVYVVALVKYLQAPSEATDSLTPAKCNPLEFQSDRSKAEEIARLLNGVTEGYPLPQGQSAKFVDADCILKLGTKVFDGGPNLYHGGYVADGQCNLGRVYSPNSKADAIVGALPPLGYELPNGHASRCGLDFDVPRIVAAYIKSNGKIEDLFHRPGRMLYPNDILDKLDDNLIERLLSGSNPAVQASFTPGIKAHCAILCTKLGPSGIDGVERRGGGSWSDWPDLERAQDHGASYNIRFRNAIRKVTKNEPRFYCAKFRTWRKDYIRLPHLSSG